jgi:hypothetical protein
MHFRNLLLIALLGLLGACGSCGSNEQAISFARELPPQRLAKLFHDVQAMPPLRPDQGQIIYGERSGVPRIFADLHPQSVTIYPGMARIHLAGCVDDKVILLVQGFDGVGAKKVTLEPGEAKDPVVLWQGN